MTEELLDCEGYPLSSEQCAVHVADGRHPAVHAVLAEGPGDRGHAERLRQALDRLIGLHEILRTCYRGVEGLRYPVQHVLPTASSAWTIFESPVDDESLLQAARSLVDPRNGPVLGAALATSPAGSLRWALAAPGYSLDARGLQELLAACLESCLLDGPGDSVPAEVLQYPDYVAWQRELWANELGREGARFWEVQASRTQKPPLLPFETGVARTGEQAECLVLTAGAEAALALLTRQSELPAETVVLALWAGFMARVAQTEGLPIEWHADLRTEELAGALGCFSMKLPVSLAFVEELPVRALLQSVADQLRTAVSWRECFDAAAYADHLARLGLGWQGVEFAYLRLQDLPGEWSLLRVEPDPCDARLRCLCVWQGDGHALHWQGAVGHVKGTLKTWMRQFAALLEAAGQHPDRPWSSLSMLGQSEREWLLRARPPLPPEDRGGPPRPDTLHGLFEAQAGSVPDALAVVCGEHRLTYRDLDLRAQALARQLRDHGVGAEQMVGVHLGRSVDVIVAMLAVLKTGAAYVPLDPAYPAQRLDDMVADAGISVVITVARDPARFADACLRQVCIDDLAQASAGAWPEVRTTGQRLAYVIYTSGSTGKPKGVMVSHANAVSSTLARFEFYGEPAVRFLLLSSPSFDSSVAGIYWTLGQGGTLYIPTDGLHNDPPGIAELIAREKISHLLALPSFYRQILEAAADTGSLRCAIVAGEACHANVVELHQRKAATAVLVNEYGPTEGTVWSNAFRIETDAADGLRIPIGRPISSMRGHVLDDRLELCPVGMPGEWYIGGEGLARGYRGRPALTSQRFVADPFGSGECLYRTGDRVRLRPDGEVEYLGRIDNQVKLRGYRIELDEIEAVLRAHERVREAAVGVHGEDELGQRLVAFVVLEAKGDDMPQQALREALLSHLRRELPVFMVPTHMVAVAALPLMPNGKLDRHALAALAEQGLRSPHVAPSDEVERTLAGIWQTVLKLERVGAQDNFFDLGGHSLLATQVTSRIRQALAVDLPLRDFFEAANLRELALRVRTLGRERDDELAAMESLVADEEAAR